MLNPNLNSELLHHLKFLKYPNLKVKDSDLAHQISSNLVSGCKLSSNSDIDNGRQMDKLQKGKGM